MWLGILKSTQEKDRENSRTGDVRRARLEAFIYMSGRRIVI